MEPKLQLGPQLTAALQSSWIRQGQESKAGERELRVLQASGRLGWAAEGKAGPWAQVRSATC